MADATDSLCTTSRHDPHPQWMAARRALLDAGRAVSDESEEAGKIIYDAVSKLERQIGETSARTPAGLLAQVQLVAECSAEGSTLGIAESAALANLAAGLERMSEPPAVTGESARGLGDEVRKLLERHRAATARFNATLDELDAMIAEMQPRPATPAPAPAAQPAHVLNEVDEALERLWTAGREALGCAEAAATLGEKADETVEFGGIRWTTSKAADLVVELVGEIDALRDKVRTARGAMLAA